MSDPFLSDQAFKVVRRLVEYVLPATGTLYFTLASIWGLPAAEEVLATIVAVTIFLAAIVGINRAAYNNSEVGVATARIAEAVENMPPDAEEIHIQVQRPDPLE